LDEQKQKYQDLSKIAKLFGFPKHNKPLPAVHNRDECIHRSKPAIYHDLKLDFKKQQVNNNSNQYI
jgi:proline dehydrogenase